MYITDSLNSLLVQINSGTFDLTFPNTNVGATSAPQTIQTSNIGNQPLAFKDLIVPMDFQQTPVSDGNVPDCTATTSLVGGQSCFIGVAFKPVSAGAKNEPLDVVNTDLNDNVSPYNTDTFNLIGTALGTLSLSPASLTFPVTPNNVGPYTPQVITVKNVGAVATAITVALGGANAADFHITATTCGVNVPVNSTCTVSITFQPTAGSGVRTGTLVATDGSGNTATANLTGTATTKSLIATPYSLDFTTANNVPSAPQVITVFNYTQKSQKVTLSGLAGTYFVETDTCAGPLKPSTGTCTVTITFNPTIPVTPTTTKTFTAVLTITGKPDTGQSTTVVTLRGTVPGTSGSTTLKR